MKRIGTLAVLALVFACGEEERDRGPNGLEGTLAVAVGGRTILVVTGGPRTSLELDGRGSTTVEMRVGSGETSAFGPTASYRAVFEGSRTVHFTNGSDLPASVHYRARCDGGVEVTIREE